MADTVDVSPNAYARATETAHYVRSQLPKPLQTPKVAIICGSGLGGLADTIESDPKVELAYQTIPNFPQSTGMWSARKDNSNSWISIELFLLIVYSVVQGHAGKFVFGLIGPQKTPVALLVGRAQSVLETYEP